MIAGTGLIAVAKDNLPRVGITPGLTVSFAEVELDTETGKVDIKEMLCVADCGTVLHPQGLGHQIAGGNVMSESTFSRQATASAAPSGRSCRRFRQKSQARRRTMTRKSPSLQAAPRRLALTKSSSASATTSSASSQPTWY